MTVKATREGLLGHVTASGYRVESLIARGGMGEVLRAYDSRHDRVVALKLIRKECSNNPKVVLRFQREIRAAGQLSHPHIVRAYDADRVNGQ